MQNIKAYIFLVLCTLFWAGNFIVGKVASLFEIPPFSLNFYRWLIAFIILFPFTYTKITENSHEIKKKIIPLSIMGFTSITIFNSVVYYSLNFTQVLNGVLMISTIPVLIIFFSSCFTNEKIKINQILGVITSLIGVLIIITKFQLNTLLSLNLNKGDLWILVAMISWATYSIMVKEKKINLDPLALLQTLIFIGLIFLIPFYLYELHNSQFLKLNIPVLLTVGYVVIFAGIGAYIFWIGAIKIIGPSRSGVFLHLMPVFSSLMAIFLLGERLANFHIFGALFILIGIIVSTKFK
ncbi:DMT family transporter [Pelagibacteraceae bacterium]|nr:DMT family transporter [Pelagibacteraceae bacterium]